MAATHNLKTCLKYLRSSNKTRDKFIRTQEYVRSTNDQFKDEAIVIPPLEGDTRWVSWRDMIAKGATPFQEASWAELLDKDQEVKEALQGSLPTHEQFEEMMASLPLLKELAIFSREAEGETYVTIPLVWPKVVRVVAFLTELASSPAQGSHLVVQALAQDAIASLTNRLMKTFVKSATTVAVVIDPRFKKLTNFPSTHRDGFWGALTTAAKDEMKRMEREQKQSPSNTGAPSQPELNKAGPVSLGSILYSDDDEEEEQPAVLSVDAEIQEYKAMTGLHGSKAEKFCPNYHADPLLWWKGVHSTGRLPILCRVARRHLSIAASSAAVERLFSYTGNRVAKGRCSMGDELLLALTLIGKNSGWLSKNGSDP